MSITVLRSTLDFLHFCQIWPSKEQELNPSKWYIAKFIIILISTLVNVVGCILHLAIVSIPRRSTYHISEDLITVTAQIGVYYYIMMYVPRQRIAANVFLKLSDFETYGKLPDFDGHSVKLGYLAMVYKWGLNGVVLSFLLEPILTRNICEKQNKIQNFEDICGLVVNAWMPFNIKDVPYKQLFYLWQMYSIYWTYETSAAISFIIVGTTEHVLIRVWHLKTLIKEAVETDNDELRRSRIFTCMKYHSEIIELGSNVDKIYVNSLFVHVLFSGVLFGIMGFSILTVGLSVKTMSLFTVWVAAAIFASFGAQRLSDASLSVAEEVYNSRWYDRDYKFQKDLIFVMQRAAKPIILHAGPFAVLSNAFILAIFKTAYSYLTLLKASSK